MLEVGSAPFTAPVAEVLEEDVGRAVEEDDGAFDELSRRAPFLACLPGTDVPSLVKVRISRRFPLTWLRGHSGVTNPSEVTKAACPSTESEDAQPDKNTSLNPVCQPAENTMALLEILLEWMDSIYPFFWSKWVNSRRNGQR